MTDRQDLLFELGTEELPPVALKTLSESLGREFVRGLESASLAHGGLKTFATPRRLAVLVKDCSTRQPDRSSERRGPAVQSAFDADGNPTQAAEGFARSCGTTVDQLGRQKTDKGEWLSFHVQAAGRPAAELLPEIAETALHHLPIPKRMRWGDSDDHFVRPVHWLVFLHGKKTVPCELMGVTAGQSSYGHRFHHPGAVKISEPDIYVSALQKAHVMADFDARREKIQTQVNDIAHSLGGQADIDNDLLDEVCSLVEWPVCLVAGFEEKYLDVPHEALIYTMKKNQKYFPLKDGHGELMNRFIAVTNIESSNPDVIRNGNERVVRPRLADAMFFWQQDGRKRLEDHIESLKSVVFEQQLGTLHDKSVRVANLAVAIASNIDGDEGLTRRAGMLSRCDLMTETVGEFAEMQGIMGRHQARRDGEPEEVAVAMDEFYMPRFSGDRLPQSRTGIAVSLAEKLDTLTGIFAIDMKPTGDKDPYALRRAALGALRILREHALPVDLTILLNKAVDQLPVRIDEDQLVDEVYSFMLHRLKGIYTDDGIAIETFEAVAQRRPGNIADFDHRLNAVIAFQQLPEAEALAAANKRIGNILKKSGVRNPGEINPDLFEQDEERALYNIVAEMADRVTPMILEGEYEQTLKILASLREPVDTFFDTVMVMTDDETIKNNRLALLTRLNHLFLQVADISHLSL